MNKTTMGISGAGILLSLYTIHLTMSHNMYGMAVFNFLLLALNVYNFKRAIVGK